MSEKESKESQYIVSHPILGSDPPFGSDQDPGVTVSMTSASSNLLRGGKPS